MPEDREKKHVQSPSDKSVAALKQLIAAGREAEAVANLRSLVAQRPAYGDGWHPILKICDQLGDEETGVQVSKMYGRAGLDEVGRQTDYARRLVRIGQMQEALTFLGKVCAHFDADADAAYTYGDLLAQDGQFEAAEVQLRKAISHRPGFGEAWVRLGAILNFADHPDDVAALKALGVKSVASVDFAYGKALDDVGDTDGAMVAWHRANEKQRSIRPFDRRLLDLMANLPEQFPRTFPTPPADAPASSPRPIFIMGAPRTGTTLTEQVLSAHPDVYGLGEALISRIATWPARHLSPGDLSALEGVGLHGYRQLGQIYASLARVRAGDKPVVTDKAATLQLFAGVLARAIPRAKFIWVTRRHEATALSAYRAHFGLAHAWSTRLRDAFDFLAAHDRLCEHWQSVLGDRMMKIPYETLVSSPEASIADMAAFCDLSADPAMAQFHTNSRPVQTASLAQVRRPFSTASVDAWQRYAPVLSAAKADATIST